MWRRVLIYFTIWAVAAFILASRGEFYRDDDRDNNIPERMLVFVGTPLVASMGLDSAITSAMTQQSPDQFGAFTWLILSAFVFHAALTLSSSRAAPFVALIGAFVIMLSLGVFYGLRVLHIYATTGHG